MNHKELENEMFRMIREQSKHIEMWLPIKGFDKYQVSTKGRVRSAITGNIIKTCKNGGYDQVHISDNNNKSKTRKNHRLMAIAFIPNDENKPVADHIDRNKSNNNLLNIRWGSISENNMNKTKQSNNTTGAVGVYWNRARNKWHAHIRINYNLIFLGCFKTFEEARQARIKAVKELFKEFANEEEF